MEAKTALIIGANRGIGLKLLRTLLERKWTVVGTIRPQSRNDPSVKDLEKTGVRILELDYTDADSIEEAAKQYGPGPLDILINNGAGGPNDLTWEQHTAEMVSKLFQTNAIGPLLASKAFYSNLKKSVAGGKIINTASGSGRLCEYNGMSIGYRMSKSSLHQLSVTLAKEIEKKGDNIIVIALHPGHLATKMSNYTNSYDMDENIGGMADVIEKVDISYSGCHINWKFEIQPW